MKKKKHVLSMSKNKVTLRGIWAWWFYITIFFSFLRGLTYIVIDILNYI